MGQEIAWDWASDTWFWCYMTLGKPLHLSSPLRLHLSPEATSPVSPSVSSPIFCRPCLFRVDCDQGRAHHLPPGLYSALHSGALASVGATSGATNKTACRLPPPAFRRNHQTTYRHVPATRAPEQPPDRQQQDAHKTNPAAGALPRPSCPETRRRRQGRST